MKALVFGGTGWVGHHIVGAFFRAGHDVTVCTRGQYKKYLDEMPSDILMVEADKNQPLGVARVFENTYDVVIDSVPSLESIRNIVEHAGSFGRYIHCSSTGGYAPLPRIPGDETMPYSHFMGGWEQKSQVDELVLGLWARQKFAATVIRPSYITGPGLLPLDNLGGRRQDFISDILSGVTLDLPNDGQSLLQPNHVQDLGKSFLLAAQEPKSIGQAYNICLTKAVTLNRYLQITAEAFSREVRVNYMPIDEILEKYAGSVDVIGLHFLATHMCFDISKAVNELGYQPHCTTEDAIAETARWAALQIKK